MKNTLFGVLWVLAIIAFAVPGLAANAFEDVDAATSKAEKKPTVSFIVDGALDPKTPELLAQKLPNLIELAANALQDADAATSKAEKKPTVSFIVDGALDPKTPELLAQKLPNLIEQDKYVLVSLSTSGEAVKKYRTANKMVINQYYTEPLHISDALQIARSLGSDYGVFVQVDSADYKIDSGLLRTRCALMITCRVRAIRVADGKVVSDKNVCKAGTSNAIYMGLPSLKNSYAEGLGNALDDLAINKLVLSPLTTSVPGQNTEAADKSASH